jgi:hypothetical protein
MNDEQVFEVAVLIRRRWAEAFNADKLIKDEKNDGSPDWALFHLDRVAYCKKDLQVWSDILNAFTADNKAIIDKALGY